MATGNMVNSFDMSTVEELEPELRSLVTRRASVLGPAYRLFYEHPVQFVRGSGVHLYDAEGNEYLDAYNNVPSVGHCHPRVVDAVSRQVATLNTHTRYASAELLDYADRLLSTLPSHIDNVMFTCTGSEAVDLALRVARYYTGATGAVVTNNAYHGTTTASAEISPSLGSGVALGHDVWTIDLPLEAMARSGDVGGELASAVRHAIADMTRHGVKFAAFVADSILSSDGLFPDPKGLLRPVVDAVHQSGGLYIADEVQPGFARTGDSMWGFTRHGLEPDLVVMGKPMGNGMPIAAVAARSLLLEEFGAVSRYFNTFGGNSVCIAAANAVLDVIDEEHLMENSRVVGAHLRHILTELTADRDDVVAVRGAGLYVAANVVSRADGSPDADRTLQVVNGMRERRVLISATGRAGNVLKIRPPLPFSRANVDQFGEAFADVLSTLT
ncbi:MAG TPA: aspartate aminotransferase family protein [Acidimicrobiales bacterium]|jgi:4-aminobutyrate aminotransferase-like enzyme|nr:aspartate aminotransferase family protein [Acidimicrobiales bacterium]